MIDKNTYALVTGASSGIGFEYARVLAEKGYNLIIISNQPTELHTSRQKLNDEFPLVDVQAVEMDLGKQSAAKELYDWCNERGFEVEVLINNAGVYHDRDFLKDSEGFNSLILNLHMYTPAMLMYYFCTDMKARGKGYVLNMSSVTSKYGAQRLASYSSTKAFLQYFSRATHVEMRADGIKVCCVRPGAVATTLYNLKPSAIKIGLALGYIITPEKLARRGVKAMFRGRAQITPGFFTKLLDIVALIPTWGLRLIRKWGIF